MSIIALIEKKISEGKEILLNLSSMRETSGMAINVVYYLSEDVDEAIRKINKWQLTVKDVLINGFGESHRYVASFAGTITKKDSGFNFRREFEHEMNEGLSVLEAVNESLKLGLDSLNKVTGEKADGTKPPMVFISHAEVDKKFANEIVTLLEFIGIKGKDKLLCTSVNGYRIPLGRDIIEYLREVFNKYELFVIILHTHNYYTRPVCLNEMGAAWALKTKYFSVLAPDFNFGDMTGVVNNKDVAIKVGADDCGVRINQLKNELIDFFGLKQPDEDRWPDYRDAFIANSMRYTAAKNDKKHGKANNDVAEAQSLKALAHSFKLFYKGEGCYPCQIDVKFAAQNEDIYFKTITLSNKKHFVELTGHNVENDIIKITTYLKPHVLEINKTKKEIYTDKVEELYCSDAIYVEDHKLSKRALETMSFHGVIALKRQMDGYDDIELDGWELHVSYNIKGEIVIPLNTIIV